MLEAGALRRVIISGLTVFVPVITTPISASILPLMRDVTSVHERRHKCPVSGMLLRSSNDVIWY